MTFQWKLFIISTLQYMPELHVHYLARYRAGYSVQACTCILIFNFKNSFVQSLFIVYLIKWYCIVNKFYLHRLKFLNMNIYCCSCHTGVILDRINESSPWHQGRRQDFGSGGEHFIKKLLNRLWKNFKKFLLNSQK